LSEKLKKVLPNDPTFETAFRVFRTNLPRQARYFLQSLEDNLKEPDQRTVTHDERKITLEHILPEKDRREWGYIPPARPTIFAGVLATWR